MMAAMAWNCTHTEPVNWPLQPPAGGPPVAGVRYAVQWCRKCGATREVLGNVEHEWRMSEWAQSLLAARAAAKGNVHGG